MLRTAHKTYLQEFFATLLNDQASKIDEACSKSSSSTKTRFYTVREQRLFGLGELCQATDLSNSDGVAIVIENIDQDWMVYLGVAWKIPASLFASHARSQR
jgi:hypothetical protein